MDPNDPSKPLQVTHAPQLNHKDAQLADQAIKVIKFILMTFFKVILISLFVQQGKLRV